MDPAPVESGALPVAQLSPGSADILTRSQSVTNGRIGPVLLYFQSFHVLILLR